MQVADEMGLCCQELSGPARDQSPRHPTMTISTQRGVQVLCALGGYEGGRQSFLERSACELRAGLEGRGGETGGWAGSDGGPGSGVQVSAGRPLVPRCLTCLLLVSRGQGSGPAYLPLTIPSR